MTQPYGQPYLPPTTIVPESEDLFIPFFNRLYEDVALIVNNKDNIYYAMTISSTAQNIVLCPSFGAFIICVSGVDSSLPTLTASLCKSSNAATGSIAVLGSQVGTGAWAGNALTITSTATNFQISHNRSNVNASFNIRLVGTQT